MTTRQMLNQILDYMARYPDMPMHAEVIAKKAGLSIDRHSACLLCDQLLADGYLSVDGDSYLILLRGIEYSKKGGYPRFEIKWGAVPEWIVAITTTLLAVLALIEQLKKCK